MRNAARLQGRFLQIALVLLGFTALAIASTWPLADPNQIALPDFDDAMFSVWRLSWVAHQLPIDPTHLFDANVFYPETGTLAFSDAMLLIGFIGAPFVWLGIQPAIVHNLLLIVALSSSATAACVLARKLGASLLGGVVAGLVFGFAPYRLAHIGHIELQWVIWMPLAMIALHRLEAKPGALNGIMLGACVAAQTLSSVYYGVFLSLCLSAPAAIAFVRSTDKRRFFASSLLALVPLLLVVLIYAPPYMKTRATYGARGGEEQQRYSAVPSDFLRVPPINGLRGRQSDGIAPEERSLYPGAAALVLAGVALVPPVSAPVATYAALGIVAFDGATGTHGYLFPLLQRVVPGISSLRSPARFGVLVLLSLAILAAIGLTRINKRWPHARHLVAILVVATSLTEYWSAPITVRAVDTRASDAHQFLAQQPPGSVVLELPVPTLSTLWFYETTYQLQSIHHWQPLVNGYSAFAPESYRRTLEVLREFPSPQSISYLQRLGVKFILLNRAYYKEAEFGMLVRQVSERQEFWPPRAFGGGDTQIIVLELRRAETP